MANTAIKLVSSNKKLTLAGKMAHAVRTSLDELPDAEISELLSALAKEVTHRAGVPRRLVRFDCECIVGLRSIRTMLSGAGGR